MEKKLEKDSIIKNVAKVGLSQILTLLCGVIYGFVIPKILGVDNYAYYKLFTLYFTYTSLLHFGFIDGILLKFSGTKYEQLDKNRMRTYSVFFISFQVVVSCFFVVFSMFFLHGNEMFVCLSVGINMLFTNITSYFQFVSQATQRFSEFSFKSIVVSVCKLVFIIILFVIFETSNNYISYKVLLIQLLLLNLIILLWYVFSYKDIIFGARNTIKTEFNNIKDIFKIGIILTIAYQVSHLVLALDRQFVSILFSRENYSIYSFAYSIISLFVTLISVGSTVMFPLMKQLSRENIVNYHFNFSLIINFVSGLALLGYFPIVLIIKWFLTEYVNSIDVLKIIFPTLLFITSISVVGFTYYKLLDKNFIYFLIGIVVLLLGIGLNIGLYFIYKSYYAFAIASIITMLIWYLSINTYLLVNYKLKFYRHLIYILVCLLIFYMIVYFVDNIFISMSMYLFLWLLSLFVVYGKDSLKKIIKNK